MKFSSLAGAIAFGLAGIAAADGPSPEVAKELAAAANTLAAGQPAVSPMFASREKEGASFMVALNAGTCYTCVAAGGSGVADVDLQLFDPTQKRVAGDRRTDRRALFGYCAPSTASYRIQVAPKHGDGEVAFQLFQDVHASAPPPGNGQPPPPPGTPPPEPEEQQPPPPPPPPIPRNDRPQPTSGDPMVDEMARMAPGMKLRKKPIAGVLPADVTVELEQGRCYSVVAVRGSTNKKMTLTLLSPAGKKITTAKTGGTGGLVVHCPHESGPHKLQIRADKGGDFRVGIFTQ